MLERGWLLPREVDLIFLDCGPECQTGGSDVILIFLTQPGLLSLCMKREAF